MVCISCNNTITPGMEIVLDELSRDWLHCPYCLQLQKSEPISSEVKTNGSEKRETIRQEVRTRFIKRLMDQSQDEKIHCPVCAIKLHKNDVLILQSQNYFKCHLCGHDLATFAYREEAYHEQRWLPVVYALTDHLQENGCTDCCYARAIARACQKAFSWIPQSNSKLYSQLTGILRHSQWSEQDCEWESCVAVKQYRKLAGEGLLLL